MLSRLDTGYIDLLLLHQQFGDYIGAWKDMEKAVAAGNGQFKVKNVDIVLYMFRIGRLREYNCSLYRPLLD